MGGSTLNFAVTRRNTFQELNSRQILGLGLYSVLLEPKLETQTIKVSTPGKGFPLKILSYLQLDHEIHDH